MKYVLLASVGSRGNRSPQSHGKSFMKTNGYRKTLSGMVPDYSLPPPSTYTHLLLGDAWEPQTGLMETNDTAGTDERGGCRERARRPGGLLEYSKPQLSNNVGYNSNSRATLLDWRRCGEYVSQTKLTSLNSIAIFGTMQDA
ncbi:hypothetical protein J6590_055420 [Homalodisca vitripennis]|nr:hypothetical protein J6590_055420 [Homalodisca vitripennis]